MFHQESIVCVLSLGFCDINLFLISILGSKLLTFLPFYLLNFFPFTITWCWCGSLTNKGKLWEKLGKRNVSWSDICGIMIYFEWVIDMVNPLAVWIKGILETTDSWEIVEELEVTCQEELPNAIERVKDEWILRRNTTWLKSASKSTIINKCNWCLNRT